MALDRVRVQENGRGELVPLQKTASERKHEIAWPKWVKFCQDQFVITASMDYETFVRWSAKRANVSIYTVENRYLRREDSRAGFLRVFRPGKGEDRLVELAREIEERDFEP